MNRNEEAKQEKYEEAMNRECKFIGFVLEANDIESCFDDQYTIARMYSKYGVELSDLDLSLFDTVDEVIDALDCIR